MIKSISYVYFTFLMWLQGNLQFCGLMSDCGGSNDPSNRTQKSIRQKIDEVGYWNLGSWKVTFTD